MDDSQPYARQAPVVAITRDDVVKRLETLYADNAHLSDEITVREWRARTEAAKALGHARYLFRLYLIDEVIVIRICDRIERDLKIRTIA